MPCPHNEITIVQRSQRQSAVAAAAYQSGEKLFCEYDQQVKHYPEKRGIVHNEILLPANAPRSYADRNTLWNAAEAVEKQWNSQLARRWVLTIPREIPPDQYAVLVREFCQQQFVSKGMIADFAIHDPHPPGHNPHAHVLLTMRAMDEHGKWLPKSRKVYDLDENGERIKLPSGRWKSHKEDTVDWNDRKYCEIWRHEWEIIQNRYLEANNRPERVDEHGVPSPSAYKLQKGIPVSTRGYDDPMWGARMIHSILTNPTYTGDLAQGRSRVKSYKVHEVESVPREEWVEVAGTHEAIIDYETFDKVQALLQRDTRTSPKGREVHLFSGFLKCADCGRAITRSVGNNNNVYYACSTYKNRSRTACTMHSIKHNRLEAAVLFAVQQQVHLAVSYSEMIARINTAPVKKSQSIRLEELIAAKERELAKISRYKQSLYQDWKDGEITQQDYRDMKADYERQTIALTDVLTRLNAERAELANGVKSEHPALVAFTKHQNIDQLSRELLVELVDHIKVYENGNISVRFKFADEFRRIAEYIEINTTKPAVAG